MRPRAHMIRWSRYCAVPIDGALRADVGILGSPPFEIPRSVARDLKFEHYKAPGVFEQRLAMKLRSNLVTLGFFMMRSLVLVLAGLLLSIAAFGVVSNGSVAGTAVALTVSAMVFTLFSALFSILCERAVCRFQKLEPQYCSLYDPKFWSHERFWKLNYNAFLTVFNGTPMKSFFVRLQGAKIGKRLFDDGAGFTEPSMVEVGDDCMLNFASSLQCHSLEDGTFKSDRIRLGSRCTVGTSGFLHYGTEMQDGSIVEADTFLMKGSVVEAGTRWLGNPARDADAASDKKLAVAKGAKKW